MAWINRILNTTSRGKIFALSSVLATLFLISFSLHANDHTVALEKEFNVDLAKLKAEYKRPKDIPFREGNAYSDAKYTLGKMLFFDPRLSNSGLMSCATCHNPALHWTDGLKHSVEKTRKTPTLLNLAWDEYYFTWDGRAYSYMNQAIAALTAPGGMNATEEKATMKLYALPEYVELFEKAFGRPMITFTTIASALEVFQRKIVSAEAPFDRWIEGDEKAISDEAKRGFILFNTKAECSTCHKTWRFADGDLHDIGLKIEKEDTGLLIQGQPRNTVTYKFKTVGLRNIAVHPPYMHTGEFTSLGQVIDFYDRGGDVTGRPFFSKDIRKLNLTKQEKKELVVFLKTLTSNDPPVTLPILPR